MKNPLLYLLSLFTTLFLYQCNRAPEPPIPEPEPTPTPYVIEIPQGFPDMIIPDNNPMTEEGIALGRKLFYDPILSADNTQSCGSCHAQEYGFTDNLKAFSVGIDGIEGTRNSMPIFNAGWSASFFWDGREPTLEAQALKPVTNPIEMHNTWPAAVASLQAHPEYPDLFKAAFETDTITKDLTAKAIAQFERTIISANSLYDQVGLDGLSPAAKRGFDIFYTERGDCFHCHGTKLFTDNDFHNNGLEVLSPDIGYGEITGLDSDFFKFKTPSLRNIEFTAPYMHDGRFQTLEEVINHYSEGLVFSQTIDPLMKNVGQGGVQLTADEKQDLIAFLKALSDTSFTNNPNYSQP